MQPLQVPRPCIDFIWVEIRWSENPIGFHLVLYNCWWLWPVLSEWATRHTVEAELFTDCLIPSSNLYWTISFSPLPPLLSWYVPFWYSALFVCLLYSVWATFPQKLCIACMTKLSKSSFYERNTHCKQRWTIIIVASFICRTLWTHPQFQIARSIITVNVQKVQKHH